MRIRDVADPLFPSTLRAWRRRRGLSLRDLANQTNYGKSYLHHLETGARNPTRDVAARLDNALDAGGQLIARVVPETEPGARIVHAITRGGRVDTAVADALAERLADYRTLEDEVGSAAMLPAALSHLAAVDILLRQTYGPARPELVRVGAQWAQWTGWLRLARGQTPTALDSLGVALSWATEANDREMIATALSFRGFAAEHASEAASMIGLAEAALRDPKVYVGQRAYDRHLLARGYALADETKAAREAIASAVDLAAEAVEDSGERPPWHYYRSAAYWNLETGLAWRLLGKADRAAECLSQGLAGLPAEMRDAEWLGQYRHALAEVTGMSPDSLGTPNA